MRSFEQLKAEVLSLPNDLKTLLADQLLESLGLESDTKIQVMGLAEAKKRRDEVHHGRVVPIPGDDALAQARKLIEP